MLMVKKVQFWKEKVWNRQKPYGEAKYFTFEFRVK